MANSDIYNRADVRKGIAASNTSFKTFSDIQKITDEDLLEKSVLSEIDPPVNPHDRFKCDAAESGIFFVALPEDKSRRLSTYRQMSNFPEVSDAIDEIADSMLNHDERDRYIDMLFSEEIELTEEQQNTLQKEFRYFISLFKLEDHFYTYTKNFIIEGELGWENLIDKNNPEYGIIGVRDLPTECLDFYYKEEGGVKICSGVLVNKEIIKQMALGYSPNSASTNYFSSVGIFNGSNTMTDKVDDKYIPLPFPQVTYINTGNYSPDRKIVFPILEKARRTYNSMSLLEQSAVIYRLARSPERYLFSIDIGKTPQHIAQQEVFKMMQRFNTKKQAGQGNPDVISNGYDPISMLDSIWTMKPTGSEGSTVTSMTSQANFEQIADIEYFRRKLFAALNVPPRRFAREGGVIFEDNENITYDEFRFAKFIIRIQNRFASALKDSFCTHLRLRKLWDILDLTESDFKFKFVPPVAAELYQQQRLFKIKHENYTALADREEFAKEPLMKKYLKYTDADIKNNEKGLIKERGFKHMLDEVGEEGFAGGSGASPFSPESSPGPGLEIPRSEEIPGAESPPGTDSEPEDQNLPAVPIEELPPEET